MPFTIRPAALSDAPSIAHIHVAGWRTTYRGIVPEPYLDSLDESVFTTRWQQWIAEQSVPILIAEDENGLFGFISGGPIREPLATYDSELYAIYLLQARHRHGAGRALVHALAAILQNRGLTSMLVWLLEANPASGFYRRLGALPITSRQIEIGGVALPEIALGWPDLNLLA